MTVTGVDLALPDTTSELDLALRRVHVQLFHGQVARRPATAEGSACDFDEQRCIAPDPCGVECIESISMSIGGFRVNGFFGGGFVGSDNATSMPFAYELRT